MADSTDLFAVAPRHAALAAWVADPRPVLVFDRSGSALAWANAAGAAYLGLHTAEAARAWHIAASHPVARRIVGLYDMLPAGQERIERIALPAGPLPRPVVTRASRLVLDERKTVLMVVVDGVAPSRDEPVAAYARFAGLDAPTDTAAEPVAETGPEIADVAVTGVPVSTRGDDIVVLPGPADPMPDAAPIAVEDVATEDVAPAAADQAPEASAPLPDVSETPAGNPLVPEEPEAIGAAPPVPALAEAEPEPAPTVEVGLPEAVVGTEAVAEPEPELEFEPEAEPEAVTIAETGTGDGFRFPEHGRTVRFVFELDADLAFRFLSDDLAATVGPAAASVVGMAWPEVADRFALDPRGRVAAALDNRDTFTGLTVDWPVEGAALRVPVDLAGMPVFGRNRIFSGYRGFGVIKTGAVFVTATAIDLASPILADPEPPEVAGDPEPVPAAIAAEEPVEIAEGTESVVPELPAPELALAEPAMAPEAEDEVIALPLVAAEPAIALSATEEIPPAEALSGEPDVEEPAATDETAEAAEPIDAVEAMVVDVATDEVVTEDEAETVTQDEVEAETIAEVEDEAEEVAPTTAEIIASPIVARPLPGDVRQSLTKPEREAFDKIAAALTEAFGARLDHEPSLSEWPAASGPAPEAPVAEAVPVTPTSVASTPAAPAVPHVDVTILDRLPVALAVLREGEIVHANRAFLDLSGYTDLADLASAGGFAGVFEGSALPREASIPAIRRKDGVEVPVSAKLHTMEFSGAFASLLVVQETAATTSRERLATAEQRVEDLEAILDTATDGVLVLDQRGLVIGANRSAEALFGVERSHMIGTELIDLLAPESHRAALDYLDGLAKNGLSSVLNDGREVIGRVAGGGLVPLFMTIGRVSLTKYCAVLRDITQWKRAEEELTAAKRSAETASSQKSDFLAKMSHEIRTPLNAIIGFSEVMMEERFGPVGNERYKEYLRDIHVSGAHIMSLVNDLLDLSKIEAGKLELNFEAVGLNDVVRECGALMQPQANRERVIIRTSLSSSLPPVVADSRSLRQIVLNLVSNAVKFNQPGGQVIVSTLYEDTGEVVLRVRDTGQGMSESDVVKALEPFRQLATTRTGQGTGLGLPLTKALVEANRAAFRIDSTPGQGTLIQITFPSTRVLAE
jgi:PAS domain S-box-containing protein